MKAIETSTKYKSSGGIHQLKCKNAKKTKKFNLLPNQEKVLDYWKTSTKKGILLDHQLGSGKTCTAIVCAEAFLDEEIANKCYVFTPGALRDNFAEEYCNLCGGSNKDFEENYVFITYNTVVRNVPDLNNSVVMIDEAHNFVNNVKNGAKTPTNIFWRIVGSKCKVIAMTATPIYNNVYELVLYGILLNPSGFREYIDLVKFSKANEDDEAVPEWANKFLDLFKLEDGNYKPRNKKKFQELFGGIISYSPGHSQEFYPKVIYEHIVKSEMAPYQRKLYLKERDAEYILRNSDMKNKPAFFNKLKIMASKYILTRRTSNFAYPKDVCKTAKLKVKKEFEIQDCKFLDEPSKRNGWIDKDRFIGGKIKKMYSPKLWSLLTNIRDNFYGKHVIFSFFKERSGVKLISSLLEMCGIKTLLYTGDASDVSRAKYLNVFNSRQNREGDIFKVLLLTDAGAEGITILEARHIHIFESDKRENKIRQVIGRVARYKSHYDMPKKQQNVHVWRYWSTYIVNEKDLGVDEKLYEEGSARLEEINSMLKLIESVAIENVE